MSKIIIIEDNEVIRGELKTFFDRYVYEVVAPINFENIINSHMGRFETSEKVNSKLR